MIGCVGRSHGVRRIRHGLLVVRFSIAYIKFGLNSMNTHAHTFIDAQTNYTHVDTSARPQPYACVYAMGWLLMQTVSNGQKEAHRKNRPVQQYINVNRYWFLSLFLYLGCACLPDTVDYSGLHTFKTENWPLIWSCLLSVHQSFVVDVATLVRTHLRHTDAVRNLVFQRSFFPLTKRNSQILFFLTAKNSTTRPQLQR